MASKAKTKTAAKAADKSAAKPAAVKGKGKTKAPEPVRVLALTMEERLHLRLYESETVRWAAESHVRGQQRDAYLRKVDPEGKLGKMTNEARAVAQKSAEAQKQYQATVKAVEDRLGIVLKDYSFDDVTGALHKQA
jgi:hypothetical protein